jgi:hypothetical protein
VIINDCIWSNLFLGTAISACCVQLHAKNTMQIVASLCMSFSSSVRCLFSAKDFCWRYVVIARTMNCRGLTDHDRKHGRSIKLRLASRQMRSKRHVIACLRSILSFDYSIKFAPSSNAGVALALFRHQPISELFTATRA